MSLSTAHSTPLLTALGELAPHHHLCSIYETPEEHFAVAIPFIRVGLDRGEKCIYIADDGTEAVVRDAMEAQGIDVDRAVVTGSLVLETKDTAYLKQGSFNPDWMVTFWAAASAEAISQGFSALRATGETEWVLRGAPGLERWMEYESRMTHTLAHHNCFALCQYNRRLFPPELVLDVIRTHPTVIYRGVVCRNMYHVPDDEFLGTNQTAREVERLLTTIREREQVEFTLRKQSNELRQSEARFQRQLEDIQLAEAALRSSEERWRSVFENSAIGIVLADRTGTFVEANRAFQELVGYTLQELKTLNYVDITHDEDIARGAEVIEEMLSGKREVQLEKRYRHKDGRFIWVRATGTVMPGSDRSPAYLLGLVEDVTDRKLAEQELDASFKQSRALAGRLMHAQDDERRRIAQMLHETTAQDLAALKMHLARLNRTASHLSETDRNLLTESIALAEQSMTEIRTLSYLLHPPLLDETGLLWALRWYAGGFAERSGIKVALELPERFERLPLDTETALFRIVQESLINIHRHGESDTARIRLRRDPETLVLEIEDRGQGIPSASLKHIMSGGGVVGVGIAAMRERIEQLGGRFEITSGDHGTTVHARVPLVEAAG
jgi:two-component system, NarL family, sensor kinase